MRDTSVSAVNPFAARCRGPARSSHPSRRELLRIGLGGFASLGLSDLLRSQAAAATSTASAVRGSDRPAIILVWLRGGCSHLDTLDPKPLAPAEFRGPFQPIATSVPGLQVTELLPNLARIAHQYSVVRSLSHTGGGHPAGSLQMLTGDPDAADKPGPRYPDWMCVANSLLSTGPRSIPSYVTVNPVDQYDGFIIAGSAYLSASYDAFKVIGDPSRPEFEVPNVGLRDESQRARLQQRVQLRQSLDGLRREIDQSGMMSALDQFEAQSLNMLLSPVAREAFDLSRESEAIRDRYGRNQWGQQCLMARRLVEAGVDIVTTEFDGPLCGRVANWDDHAVNHHVFDAISYRAPFFDQAVSALIEEVYQRGLDRRVLVVVTGEFGRTPRISYVASSGGGVASGPAGTVQPGRDHWPQAGSMIFAGGGIRTGQIIGATDKRGEAPVSGRVTPEDFLATLYRHLRIPYEEVKINDFSGRPTPIIRSGRAIPELQYQA